MNTEQAFYVTWADAKRMDMTERNQKFVQVLSNLRCPRKPLNE